MSVRRFGLTVGWRTLLAVQLAICFAAVGCASHERPGTMEDKVCTIDVQVLAHWLIQRFDGEALLAAAQPRFVVAVTLSNTKAGFPIADTGVELTTYRVVFFAIDSVTKVFSESDVVGKRYRLEVRQLNIDGNRRFVLTFVDRLDGGTR
jgi:hypothetical protein